MSLKESHIKKSLVKNRNFCGIHV